MADPRITTRPLLQWPGGLRDDRQRKPCPFNTRHTDTVELLTREARMLGAREVVIQMAIDESQIRLDGQPYASAKTKHPGVTVVLPESSQGRISWSTDRYRGQSGGYGRVALEGWQVNLRAIALSMEALRAADRHGVMQGRQYAGFRELGSGIVAPERVMTVEEAARYICRMANHPQGDADQVIADPDLRKVLWRELVKRYHPDTGFDDGETMTLLSEAREVLERHV